MKTVDLEDSEFLFEYKSRKTTGLTGLGRRSKSSAPTVGPVGSLADFREIFVFICETLKTRQFARAAMVIESVQFLLSTGLVFLFFNWKPCFRQDHLKPAVLKNLVFDWTLSLLLCEVCLFHDLAGFKSPIKHTPTIVLQQC